jgi:Bacterial membrane protein YfhO
VYVAAVLALLWPVLVGGRVLSPASVLYFSPPWHNAKPADVASYFNVVLSDLPTVYYPWWNYAREAIHAGEIPEWNPHALTGTPFFANAQSALLSPFSLPLWLLPFNYALGIVGALQLWLTAFGTYLLARELRLGFAPAFLAGLAFGFSVFSIVWLTYPLMGVIAMLPWALWLAERIIRRAAAADALFLTLVLTSALLAGHPGTQVHVYAVVAVYASLRLVLERGRGALLRRAVLCAVPFALALALGAVALLPVALTIRDTVGLEVRSSGSLTLPDTAMRTVFFPDWWGRPSDQYLPAPVNFNEGTIYAGAVALVLAAVALISRGRWREKAPFALLGVVGFQAAFALEPTAFLLEHAPVLENNRNARLSVLVQLSVAVLAGFGLQRLLDRGEGRRAAAVCAGAFAVGLAGLVAAAPSPHDLRVTANHFRTGTDYAIPDVIQTTTVGWWLLLTTGLAAVLALRSRLSATTVATAVVLLVGFDAAHFARGYNPMAPEQHAYPKPPPSVEFLQRNVGTERIAGIATTLPPDTSMVYGLRDVRGNDPPMPTLRFMRVFWLVNPTQPAGNWLAITAVTRAGLRVLSALNVRWLILPPGSPPSVPGLRPAYSGPDAVILRNPAAVPRAYLPRAIKSVSSESAALDVLASDAFVPGRLAVVEGRAPPAGSGKIAVVRDEPETVELTARLARGGLVVVPDTFADGWSVTVDGEEAEPLRVNSVQRGVEVPAGRHSVRWSYRTPGLVLGAGLSMAGLVAAAGWTVWLVLARRRRQRARPTRSSLTPG